MCVCVCVCVSACVRIRVIVCLFINWPYVAKPSYLVSIIIKLIVLSLT